MLTERDQERERLEQAGRDHAAERARLLGQVEALSARMGDFAREAQNLRAELERLKGRGWLARLLNL